MKPIDEEILVSNLFRKGFQFPSKVIELYRLLKLKNQFAFSGKQGHLRHKHK